MPPAGFEPTISADERPQTYALDRADIETGTETCSYTKIKNSSCARRTAAICFLSTNTTGSTPRKNGILQLAPYPININRASTILFSLQT